jgi:hypothetical protein
VSVLDEAGATQVHSIAMHKEQSGRREPVSLAKEGARSCRPRLEVGATAERTDYTQKNKKSPCTHCFAIGIAVLSRLPATAAAAVAAA